MASYDGLLTRAVSRVRDVTQFAARRNPQKMLYDQVKTEEDHELDANQQDGGLHPAQGRLLPDRSRRTAVHSGGKALLAAFGLVAVLLVAVKFLAPDQADNLAAPDVKDHKLYLLVPSSNEPDLRYCQTQLTAGILGYPTLQMLNHEYSGRNHSDRERDKIRITNDHLGEMGEDRDDDMVILLENANAWFQLSPEVLMKRYYSIIHSANARAQKSFGKKDAPRHRIVFAAQNYCSEQTAGDLSCFPPPDSPVGESTLNHINAGFAIGPVKEMRKLVQRINGKAIAGFGVDISQQSIVAQLFGAQELRREFVRQGRWSSRKRKLASLRKFLERSNTPTSAAGQQLLMDPEKANHELGIALDRDNELGFSLTGEVDMQHVDWVSHNSHSAPTLSEDIRQSRPPYWTTTSSKEFPLDRKWRDVPLLSSTRTGRTPAIIKIAAGQGSTNMANLDWSKLWLQSHAKQLWTAQNEISRLPLMSVVDGQTEHVFWNQDMRTDRQGAKWLDDEWKSFSDYCGFDERDELVLREHEEAD